MWMEIEERESFGCMRTEAPVWHGLGMLWRLEIAQQLMRIKSVVHDLSAYNYI